MNRIPGQSSLLKKIPFSSSTALPKLYLDDIHIFEGLGEAKKAMNVAIGVGWNLTVCAFLPGGPQSTLHGLFYYHSLLQSRMRSVFPRS